jgi:cytochrome P450
VNVSNKSLPSHVPPDRVFSFNIYSGDEWLKGDLHESLKALHSNAPDIFYTPANGGHWVITRFKLIDEVLRDPERFSSKRLRVPLLAEEVTLLPIHLDPPDHAPFRRMLNRHFGPPQIKQMEPKIRDWAHRLIAKVVDEGECDFADSISTVFPVSIFMEFMGLPLDRLQEYRAWVVEYFSDIPDARRLNIEVLIGAEMRKLLDARTAEPRDDLASKLLREELDGGRRLTSVELDQLCTLLFQAGMDTVTNFATFFFHFFGQRPDLQRLCKDNPQRIPDVIEEGFRRFGVVSPARLVAKDTTVGDVEFRKGDMVLCVLPLAGLDERRNSDPETFDADRKGRAHMLFSQGIHLCLGHQLARAEMRILLDEWVKAIPEFRVADGYLPHYRASQVMGLAKLPLKWNVA